MNNLQKALLIFFAMVAVAFAPSAMNAQDGNWSDNRDETWGTDYSNASSFTITTAEQLAQFAYMVNNGSDFSGKTVTLDDGVEEVNWGGQIFQQPLYYEGNLSDHYWTPIGTASNPFNGTFNGNSKGVNYVKINDSEATYQGLFGYIGTGGIVKNLVFEYGSNISGSTQVGTLAGYNAGTVQNCLVLNATISGTGYVGSIIGQNAGTVTGCYSIDCSNGQDGMFALGADGSTTGVDSDGHAQCLYNLKADENTISSYNDFNVTVGSTTGVQVGSGVYYTDGIQYNAYHYFKTGSTTTLTYNIPGYVVTFAVSGTGASISGNVVTVGTGKITVSLATKEVAEWSGSGNSADDPYIIYTREQLDKLATRVNTSSNPTPYRDKYFKLNNDLSYSDNNNDYDYHVIGTSVHPFCGVFDGNGKTISYASSIVENESLQGIFGHIGEDGVVKNLGTKNCSFEGTNFIGVIAGDNAGTIENCRVAYDSYDNVISTQQNYYYGTIAGRNSGIIRNCVSAGSVKVNTNGYKVGGIVGYNTGTMENCLYLGGQLEGTGYVGAIVGHNEGTLTNNYYHDNGYNNNGNNYIGTTVLGVGDSNTSADTNGAALAKVVKLPEGGTFSNPYGATISGTPTSITENNPNGMPLSVYSDGVLFRDTYLANSNNLGTAFYTTATTVELEALNVPSGYAATFSTTSDGASINGNTLTVGTDVTEITVSAQRVATGWLADGTRAASFSTTDENSITIMSAAELGLLAYNVNFGSETYSGYTITLGADINLSGNTWEPIGFGLSSGGGMVIGGGSASGFLGTFDGAGHTISNLNSGTSGVGLFTSVSSTVQNVTIENATVSGTSMVGIVAGSCTGTIQNCRVVGGTITFVSDESGSGSVGASAFGGIAGYCSGGTITNCSVIGTTITASATKENTYIGGIVGMLSPSRVIDYENYTMSYSPASLTNNIFSGTISEMSDDSEYFGAIAGASQEEVGTANTIANNYYSTGTIGGINNADVTENDGAVFAVVREIAGYGDGNDKWAFIASPVSGSIHPGNVHYLLGQNISTTSEPLYNFDLYRLNPGETKWENYNNPTHTSGFNLVNGYGYLYATKETKTLVFTGTYNTADSETVGLNEGFNLVGNPFTVDAYVNRPYYKMNSTGTALELVPRSTNSAIAPCTGVVVEYKDGNQCVFTKAPVAESSANNSSLNIAVAQQVVTRSGANTTTLDNAIVSFNEGDELGKFYFGSQNANLYIPQGTEEYAIATSNGQGEMPINFKANENGSYTITVSPESVEMNYLHLIDNMTGADVDLVPLLRGQGGLKQPATYTFTAKTTDYESRFKLVFACGDADDDDNFAFFSNGNLIVNGTGTLQIIDILGRELVRKELSTLNSQLSTLNYTPGVYVLRLINGNDVRVQKIVVR